MGIIECICKILGLLDLMHMHFGMKRRITAIYDARCKTYTMIYTGVYGARFSPQRGKRKPLHLDMKRSKTIIKFLIAARKRVVV